MAASDIKLETGFDIDVVEDDWQLGQPRAGASTESEIWGTQIERATIREYVACCGPFDLDGSETRSGLHRGNAVWLEAQLKKCVQAERLQAGRGTVGHESLPNPHALPGVCESRKQCLALLPFYAKVLTGLDTD